MAPSDRPLLAGSRTASENEADREATEEDALLTHQRPFQPRRQSWWEWFVLTWAFIATAAVIILAVLYQHAQTTSRNSPNDFPDYKPTGKRNLVFMVSDGMGPASLSLTRSYHQLISGLPPSTPLTLDTHLIGTSRTRSSSSLITDSAAGATAFSCGAKSYNGAISVTPNGTPCATVLEAAKRAGYKTGLVVTTRITDATPATFAAHVRHREEEDSIARQLVGDTHSLGHVVDLMFGGGRCHFMPNETEGSCRGDDVDVLGIAEKKGGYTSISTRKEFDALQGGNAANLPMIGLFAGGDMPFEIDRRAVNETFPSLEEMARTAMTALEVASKGSDKGFFLLVEGSRIDHAGHENDPAAQVHEVLAYDRAFAAVLEFLERSENDGVLVGTSDHETGGLSVGRQLNSTYPDYLWLPSVLARAETSCSSLARALHQHSHQTSSPLTPSYLKSILSSTLGITDPTPSEISSLINANGYPYTLLLSDMLSRRAQIGWSSHGHSAVDVNIYASDVKKVGGKLSGNRENTEVGEFLRGWMGVGEEVEAVGEELRGEWEKEKKKEKGAGGMVEGSKEEEEGNGGRYEVVW